MAKNDEIDDKNKQNTPPEASLGSENDHSVADVEGV